MDQARNQRVHVRLKPVQPRLGPHCRKTGRVDCSRIFFIGAQNGQLSDGANVKNSYWSISTKSAALGSFGFSRTFGAMRVLCMGIDRVCVIMVVMVAVRMRVIVGCGGFQTANACAKRITIRAVRDV